MAIDPQSVGYETPPIDFEYDWRDTILYALGVGARPDRELDYLYEGRGPQVLPTFCTIPTFAAFDPLVDRIGCDRTGMLHHSQRIDVLAPLRPSARLQIKGRVVGVYDLKRMAMSVFDIDAHDERGEAVARGRVTLVLLKDGGFGGEAPPRIERVATPDREPDFEVRERIPASQALLYRLSGDYNPLHADPAFAESVGLERPILHGLCTFGYAGRAVIQGACAGDPGALTTLRAQFSRPVYPGDTLVMHGWRDQKRVVLRVTTEERPQEPCLSHAYALLR